MEKINNKDTLGWTYKNSISMETHSTIFLLDYEKSLCIFYLVSSLTYVENIDITVKSLQ